MYDHSRHIQFSDDEHTVTTTGHDRFLLIVQNLHLVNSMHDSICLDCQILSQSFIKPKQNNQNGNQQECNG
jgi:hypothetical protein